MLAHMTVAGFTSSTCIASAASADVITHYMNLFSYIAAFPFHNTAINLWEAQIAVPKRQTVHARAHMVVLGHEGGNIVRKCTAERLATIQRICRNLAADMRRNDKAARFRSVVAASQREVSTTATREARQLILDAPVLAESACTVEQEPPPISEVLLFAPPFFSACLATRS